jgi:E3 ubiquitin-protein ligase mind-bomb
MCELVSCLGGSGTVGEVKSVGHDSQGQSWKSWVKVKWTNGSANDYRRGHEGLVDLKYQTAAVGGTFFVDHLPVLGKYKYHCTCR